MVIVPVFDPVQAVAVEVVFAVSAAPAATFTFIKIEQPTLSLIVITCGPAETLVNV